MPDALQQRCQHIVTSPVLTPEQKRHFLALEAENNLPYPALPEAAAPRWTRDSSATCSKAMRLTNRATCCRTTLNFWLTAQNGWSWKGLRSG